jgi:ribosomal protein S18 acetylase RimI-like enzyme
MNELAITVMNESDIDFALELTTSENWGNVAADFQRLLTLEPGGCFVARIDGQPVGMITTTTHGELGFIGSLIVRRQLRGRGIGGRLLQRAMSYLNSHGVTTQELDGVFAAVSLYRRYGFQDKYLSLRFRGVAAATDFRTTEAPAPDGDKILRLDRELTGLNRARVIGRLLDDCTAMTSGIEGKLTGYAVVRRQAGGLLSCGPIIATSPLAAEELLHWLCRRYAGRTFGVGVPEGNRVMVRLLQRLAFKYLEPSLRMYHGRYVGYEDCVYGIISPEKG